MLHTRRRTWLTYDKAIFFISVCILTLSCFVSVEAAKPDAEVFLAQGTLAYEQQQYDTALGLLMQAKEQDPTNARIYYYLGLVQLARQSPNEAVPYLEKGLELRPSDFYLRYQLGVAYFAAGDYEKADPLLSEVYQERPELDSLGFYVGYCRYREKDYDAAMQAFEQCQTDDFDIRQLARFYRGMTLGVLGLPQQAVEELEGVQSDRAVTPFAAAATRMREKLAATKTVSEKKRLRLQMSIGGFYDDNVAINPDKVGTIPAAGQSQTIANLRARKTTSPGFLASLFGEYAFFRQGPWEAKATGSFFQTLNTNDGLSRLNIREFLGGLGGFYRGEVAQRPFQVGLQYSLAYLFLDEAAFLMRHRPTLTGAIVGPSFDLPGIGTVGNLTTGLYRFEYKTFFREIGDDDPRFGGEIRDGHNNMIGFLHAFRLLQDTILLRLGYQFDVEDTDGRSFRYTGNRFLTGGQVTLPWADIKVSYDYDIHWRNYTKKQTLFTDRSGTFAERHDRQHTHVVQIVTPLPQNFSVTAQYQGVRNYSRIPIFDYTKNVFSLIVTWTY
ncbi:MAG: tetratricopeptide repeat protein [Nitrospirales bacterium]